MLDLAFRNIMRQKSRTILTVLGILIGIGAIVALGSVSEGIRTMVQEELSLISGKVMVLEEGADIMGGGWMGSDITQEQVDELSELSGVDEAVPMLCYIPGGLDFGNIPDWYAYGMKPSQIEIFLGENVGLEDGVMLEEGDTGSVIIGKDVADKLNYVVGDTVTVKDTEFEIIGIVEKTEVSDIDLGIVIDMETFQDMLDKYTYQFVYVIPENPAEAESTADSINSNIEGLQAISDKDITRMAEEIVANISFFTFSIGAIAAFVGGLTIMNTMIMAVMERRREIGTMKAMGATSWVILRQIITESALISLIGAVGGILAGTAISYLIGAVARGMITATVTPGLALTGLVFALFLGVVGGLYPARKAVKLDPVEALRYE